MTTYKPSQNFVAQQPDLESLDRCWQGVKWVLDNLIQSLLVETQLQDQDENHTGLPESEAPTAEVSS